MGGAPCIAIQMWSAKSCGPHDELDAPHEVPRSFLMRSAATKLSRNCSCHSNGCFGIMHFRMKYLVFALSSFLLTALIWAGFFWLLSCGDWTAAPWCRWADQGAFYAGKVLFPISSGTLRVHGRMSRIASLCLVFLPLTCFLFLLQLYVAHRIRIRRRGKQRA